MTDVLDIGGSRNGIFIEIPHGHRNMRFNFSDEAGTFVEALQKVFHLGAADRAVRLRFETAEWSYNLEIDPHTSQPLFVNHRVPQGPNVEFETLLRSVAMGEPIYMNDKGLVVDHD